MLIVESSWFLHSDEQSVWPSGTYGLMRTAQGCPDGTWQVGWRQQDSEDFGTANDYSSNIEFYLAGKGWETENQGTEKYWETQSVGD